MSRSDHMLAAEMRKLRTAVPSLLARYGLVLTERPGDFARWSQVHRCMFTVYPIFDGHPWLACRFVRPYPRPDLPWNASENERIFQDIRDALGSVNPHSGKYNCHIFERLTAKEVLVRFESHLKSVLLPVLLS